MSDTAERFEYWLTRARFFENYLRKEGFDVDRLLDIFHREWAKGTSKDVQDPAPPIPTDISGYSPHGPMIDPPDRWCPRCYEDEHACTCNEPPHEADYLAAWRDGEFDDDLVGYAEEITVVGFERVVAL